MTNRDSFASISDYWLNEVESYADPTSVKILVGNFMSSIGNKSDLRNAQVVPTSEASSFAREHKMMFFETSAKTA